MTSKKEKNERKRQRYAEDPEYRAMILESNRKSRVAHREERKQQLVEIAHVLPTPREDRGGDPATAKRSRSRDPRNDHGVKS
jgi:protoheme ferro-lyase